MPYIQLQKCLICCKAIDIHLSTESEVNYICALHIKGPGCKCYLFQSQVELGKTSDINGQNCKVTSALLQLR